MFYPTEKRQIFAFDDGSGQARHADPLRARRLLLLHTNGDLQQTWERAREVARCLRGQPADPEKPDGLRVPLPVPADALEAEGRLLAAAREAFSLAEIDPLTGEGVGDGDVWRILSEYSRFLKNSVGGGESGPTSSPATGAYPGPR